MSRATSCTRVKHTHHHVGLKTKINPLSLLPSLLKRITDAQKKHVTPKSPLYFIMDAVGPDMIFSATNHFAFALQNIGARS